MQSPVAVAALLRIATDKFRSPRTARTSWSTASSPP